ncbi:MAG: hypothetical protein B7Z40_08440, partial [Bosea sp. 12-68-7]
PDPRMPQPTVTEPASPEVKPALPPVVQPTQPSPPRSEPQAAVVAPPPVAAPPRPDPRMPQPTVTEPVRPPAPAAVPPTAQPRPEAPPAATGRSDPAQVAVAQPPRPPIERVQRYIATYDGGPCFFLWPTELTATRAVLEGFGNRTEPFVAFDSAFKAAQGFEAQIHLRPITAAQCPMADFLRALGDNIDRTPRLQINAFNMKSGEVLSGTIDNDGGRNVAVVLIGDDGLVYNLGSYLRRDGRRATFNLKLESAGGGPRPQTVLTFVSTAPLPALSGPNPTPSTDFFASLKQDVLRQGEPLGLGVRYFRIE